MFVPRRDNTASSPVSFREAWRTAEPAVLISLDSDYRIDIPCHMLTMASTDRGRSAFDSEGLLDWFLEPDLCGMEIGLVNGYSASAFVGAASLLVSLAMLHVQCRGAWSPS